jgi:GxxExxY protein
MPPQPIPPETEAIAEAIVDSAIHVHKALGPGLLESVYEACLCHEFGKRQLRFKRQLVLPVVYDGMTIDSGLRLDLLVENVVIVELKAIEQMLPLYQAQLLTYLKLSGKRVGLLINFNVPVLKDGIKRVAL